MFDRLKRRQRREEKHNGGGSVDSTQPATIGDLIDAQMNRKDDDFVEVCPETTDSPHDRRHLRD